MALKDMDQPDWTDKPPILFAYGKPAESNFMERQRKLVKDAKENNGEPPLKNIYDPNRDTGRDRAINNLNNMQQDKVPGQFDSPAPMETLPGVRPQGVNLEGRQMVNDFGVKNELTPNSSEPSNSVSPLDTGVEHGPRNYPTPYLQNPANLTKQESIQESAKADEKFPKAPMISASYKEPLKGSIGGSPQKEEGSSRELFTKENSDMGWQERRALNQQILANEGKTSVQGSRADTDVETQRMRVQGLKDIEGVKQNRAQAKNAQDIKDREAKNLKAQHELLSEQLKNPLLAADARTNIEKQLAGVGNLLQSSLQTPGQLEKKKASETQASSYLQ